ncbi:MAG: DUF3488 and transglutaminase-like domain-containing protein [Wenzhouxiangella sp.]|nr:DUF3488 and transglutaminase-like domain-containing protein [Wenzhouxiangella sp.]
MSWTLAALFVAVLPHLLFMPAPVSITILALLGWRALAAWKAWRPLPGWLRLVLTLGLFALVLVAYGGMWGRRTATALLCVMLAAKLTEMYRIRDLRLVASVCFFLIATQFLFSERMIYLFYLAAGCLVATMALYQIQQIPPERVERIDRPVAPDPRLTARAAGSMLALALPVALIMFVLFPRLSEPLWGLPEQAMDGRTGLGDFMSPGSIANLFIDDTPAFRATFEDGLPDRQYLYWRGPVLWNFDGNTWRPGYHSDRPAEQPVPITDNSIRYRIQLEPHERRWLLGLDHPVRSSLPESSVTSDHVLVSRHPVTGLVQYDVISTPDFVDTPVLTSFQRRLALSLPEGRNPRTLALGAELRERYGDDRELIASVLRWFSEEAFYYNLSTAPLGRHGADEFLFDLRTGYCEYYASAFAVLMRAAGIPTRVVTGYQGGFWHESGGYLLVRQGDAHAWNEVWLEGLGWTRVDPTSAVSPLRIEQGARIVVSGGRFLMDWPWVRDMLNRYDRLQHIWNNWVLGFNADRQRNFLKRLGLPDLNTLSIAMLMLAGLALVIAPIFLVLLKVRETRPTSAAQRAWMNLLRRLRHRGLRKLPHETPEEFARRIAAEQQTASAAPALLELAQLYSRVHYGPPRQEMSEEFIDRARRFSWR